MSKITFQDKENLQSNPSVLRINKVIDEDINEIKEVVNNNDTNTNNNFGDSYSTSNTYNVGDYCVYQDKLYRCITTVATAEVFDSDKWEQVNVANEINNKFEWKFLKSVTGKTPISLPENFNELFICCNLNNDHYTNIIPKVILSTTSKNFNINGRKTSSSYGAGATSDISLSSYVLRFLYSNDVDRSQEATSTIYYR